MYEEDRLRALDLYNSIFEEVDNDTEVLQLLVSPTRQAVNLARSYDAKERKLQVHTQSRAGENLAAEEEPAFVQVIEELRAQAEELGIAAPRMNDDQISLFEEPDVAETVFDNLDLDAIPEADDVDEDGFSQEEPPETISLFPDEDREEPPLPAAPETPPAEEAAAPAEETKEEPAEESGGEVEEFSDAVDAFLADFSIKDDELGEKEAPHDEKSAPVEDFPADEESAARVSPAPLPAALVMDRPAEVPAPAAVVVPAVEKPAAEEPALSANDTAKASVKKPRVALLIVYILFAIPVCLLLIGLLLALAAAVLSIACAALYTGVFGLGSAFTSFSVFADILLVFGIALVIAAVGLLCFWLFVRLIFSAIPGVVRGAFELGRKWCYKEVAQA